MKKLQIGDKLFLGKSIKDPLRIEAEVTAIDSYGATLSCTIINARTKKHFEARCTRIAQQQYFGGKKLFAKDIAEKQYRRHLWDLYWQVIEEKRK